MFSPAPPGRRQNRMRPSYSPGNQPRMGTPQRIVSPSVSGMDVDHAGSVMSERDDRGTFRSENFFAKSDELSAAFYAHLPVEVKQVLKNADFYRDGYTGDIDTLTGFALVASVQTCFVWQHAQAVKGTPTCYIFACPQDATQPVPPFHVLVPYGHSREPGLILISVSGQVRFWQSVGIGLAGGDQFSTTSLELEDDENVTTLLRTDPQTYIATTTNGRLFRLALTSAGGKQHLTLHVFSLPASSSTLSRFLPSLFSAPVSRGIASEPGNISAIALGQHTATGGREIWTLMNTRIQRWDMKAEGWEELIREEDVADVVRGGIRAAFENGVSSDNASLDLELVDLAIDSDGRLVLLISYAGLEDDTSMNVIGLEGIRRIYALLRLADDGDSFVVQNVSGVPYQSTSSSGAPMHPRIKLMLGGTLATIQFGDAVAICARDSAYLDRIALKSATDRTLGVGIIPGESSLLVLTAATMMKAHVDMDQVELFDPETGQANLIKSIMTQAILYGSNVDNPLHFSFPPEVDEESLMTGAEQLSEAVLSSDPEVVYRNHDLGAQMISRKERLSWLIRFINDNAVLFKMSQRCRQHLAMDAEKLYAAHQLWLLHNDLLVSPTHSNVLTEAVNAFMADIEEEDHEDLMRTFFRQQVSHIGRLLRKVNDIAMSSGGNEAVLSEANDIFITVIRSAFEYRDYNLGVYGIDLPMIRPWTSKSGILDIVLGLFDATARITDSLQAGQAPSHNTQLPELAALLFACMQERLEWLNGPIAASQAGTDRDKDELITRFAMLRPEVLESLRRGGYATEAFALAEKYRDFSSLAALCHREVIYPPYQNPHAARIQSYMDRFKDDFAIELYRWCIQNNELRILFALEGQHDLYLDRFFRRYPHPSISWVHDLGKKRHGVAAETLLSESEQATHLETKHIMLSIGKLSHLAQVHEAPDSANIDLLDAFHDDLDFVSVHEALLREFKAALEEVRGRHSLDSQVDIIIKATAANLSNRLALSHTFRRLIRELLEGKALSIEDAVDVLTLKDNSDSVDNYATALHLLARVKNLPQARRASAFRTVWRRIYIHDDWDAIRRTSNVTDAELNERFQRTALYTTLCAIIPKQHQPEGYDTPPASARVVPTIDEIGSRWPGMSQEEVLEIEQDYLRESQRLADFELDDVYFRVREIAARDLVWASTNGSPT